MPANSNAMEKQWVKILTCDPRSRRIEGILKDYGTVQVSLNEIPPIFRWPKEGEWWQIARENYDWFLRAPLQDNDEDAPKVEDFMPGDTVITSALGSTTHLFGDVRINGEPISAMPPGWINIQDHGAVGDGYWDSATSSYKSLGGNEAVNTAAIQAALDEAKTDGVGPVAGAVVYFPPGIYVCNGQLNFDGANGITLQGIGMAPDLGTSSNPRSVLVYSGNNNYAQFIRCRNSYATIIDKMMIMANLPFKGVLVDASNQAGGDSQFLIARNSAFGGIGNLSDGSRMPGPFTCISLWNAIFCTVDNCHFGNCVSAVRGKEEVRVFVETMMPGGGGENEVTRVTAWILPTQTYTLTVNGQTTATINPTDDATTMQTKLEALSNVAPGDVVVTTEDLTNVNGTVKRYTLAWQGALANTDMTVTTSFSGSTGYSNVVSITRNTYLRVRKAVVNPNETWTFWGNGAEGLQGGGPARSFLKHAVTCDLMGGDSLSLESYENNWHGDAFGDQVWVKGNKHGVSGTIRKNQFSGGWVSIDANAHGESGGTARGPLTVRDNGGGGETNFTDSFGSNTIANYNFDAGGGEVVITGGVATVTNTNRKRFYPNNIGAVSSVDFIDFRQSLKVTPDATLTKATGFSGKLVKRLDADNYIYAGLDHSVNPPQLQVWKVVNGAAAVQLGSNLAVTTAIANGVPFWVRAEIGDDMVYAEYWTAAPAGSSDPEKRLAVQLTGADNARFGCRVGGYPGDVWEPCGTGWTYDDRVILPRQCALDIGRQVLSGAQVGIEYGGSASSHSQGWPPFMGGAGLTDPIGDKYLGHARIAQYPVTMNGNGIWATNRGYNSPRIQGGDAGENERQSETGAATINIRHYTKELNLTSNAQAPTAINGAFPGQVITITGDNNTRTIVPSSHFVIKGDMIIRFRDTLTLCWDNGVWIEVGRSKNADGAQGAFYSYQEINTNANFTISVTSPYLIRHTGTLTADRTATLSTTNAAKGEAHLITRTGGGAFNIIIGGSLSTLATDEWCEIVFDGTLWFVARAGARLI